jgi:Viral coat protein P2 N-terminal domain
MATKRIVNLPNVSGWIGGVGGYAAHTIVIDLPVGPRYHEIWLDMNAGASLTLLGNVLGEMRLKVNGKTQRTFTGPELNFLNILNGVNYACIGGFTNSVVASLCIYLAEPWREDEYAQDGLAWATGDVSTFQLEIDMLAVAASAGLTKPLARAVIDNSLIDAGNGKMVDQPMGAIVKVANVQIPVASGTNDFGGLPKKDFYQSLHVIDANLTDFEVKVDNNIIRQDTVGHNRNWLKAHGMLPNPSATATPYTVAADLPARTTYHDIVFDHDDKLGSSLPMRFNGKKVGDFNLRLVTTTTGNVKCLYQTIGPAD